MYVKLYFLTSLRIDGIKRAGGQNGDEEDVHNPIRPGPSEKA